jgi:hypothetical protein
MAKVQGALFSMDAAGAVGKVLVVTSWKGRQVMRKWTVPSNPKSGPQMGVRGLFAGAVLLAKALITADKAGWVLLAATTQITWLNAFVAKAQQNMQALMGPQKLVTRVSDVAPAICTTPAAAVAGNKVTFSWVAPADADKYAFVCYRSASTGYTPGPATIIRCVAAATLLIVDTPGIGTWYYIVKCCDVDGNLGPATAQATAVVV